MQRSSRFAVVRGPSPCVFYAAPPFHDEPTPARFDPQGWECDFRTHEAIPYRMVEVSSLCVPSGAIWPQELGMRFSDP